MSASTALPPPAVPRRASVLDVLGTRLRAGIDELRRRPRGQVPVLDALRALAVLLVVCDHTFSWWLKAGGRPLAIAKFPVFYFGWTGVDLFFILSGYLIGRQLWREFADTGGVRVGRFVLRRGFRIWPLYVAFAIGTPLLAKQPFRLSDWLFYSNYHFGTVMGGWSLSTEEQFYLLLPAAVALTARRLGLRGWTVALPLLLVAVELARLLTARHLYAADHSVRYVKAAMYSAGHLRCQGLLVGAWIALLHQRMPALLAPAETRRGRLAAVGIGAGALLAAGVIRTASPVVLPYFALAVAYGGLAVMLLRLRASALVRRLGLESLALYRVSRLSYGVYLNHFWVVKWVLAVATPLLFAALGNNHASFLTALALGILASMAAAAVTFVVIEHPFLAARSLVLHTRSPGVAPVPAGPASDRIAPPPPVALRDTERGAHDGRELVPTPPLAH